ncbi:cytochrome c [Flavobacterium sp.]|uniref:c-type cytochrome n=1 Tax=Flavobacterium sp. TaxID=239 RepID=UPI00286E6B4E|nr:cytochrome c [Flavobacterium sp.]
MKLYYGFGLVLLGLFPLENPGLETFMPIKDRSIIVTKATGSNDSRHNIQDAGKEIYADFCIQCHGANGKGDGKNFPPLAGSDWLTKSRTESIHAVKFGQNGEIVVNKKKFNNNMPTMGLSNKEVADVMNYVMNAWGNKQKKKVTEKEVATILN